MKHRTESFVGSDQQLMFGVAIIPLRNIRLTGIPTSICAEPPCESFKVPSTNGIPYCSTTLGPDFFPAAFSNGNARYFSWALVVLLMDSANEEHWNINSKVAAKAAIEAPRPNLKTGRDAALAAS